MPRSQKRISLRKKISDFKRFRFILSVIMKAGGGILLEQMKLKRLVSWRCRIHCFFHSVDRSRCLISMQAGKPVVRAKVLRTVLERLGPTFIKLGQVLSLRSDLVGEEIANELSSLQSDVPSFPYNEVREIIKEDLGADPKKIYKTFESKPIAAASIAQVHKATLPNGTIVAVKVQRPKIRTIIEQDMHILFYLAHLLERFVPESRAYRPSQAVKEFADWTQRELDFRAEGHNADHFRAIFKDNKQINIPSIYWEFTSSRILSMDFVHGLPASEVDGMKRLGIDRKKVANYGVNSLLRQFFIEGFFHADPHPGNLFVLKGNIMCFHDFGMVGYLTEEQRRALLSCFMAFVNRDTDSFQKHFLRLADTDDLSDVTSFRKDITRQLDEFIYSTQQSSLALAFFRLINNGAKYGVCFPADLILFGKALLTTESMGLTLYPQFDFNKSFQPFVKKLYLEYLDPKKVLKNFESNFFDYVSTLTSLPEKLQEIMTKIEQGEIGVKINTDEFISFEKEFNRQNNLKVLSIILTSLIITTSVLFYLEGKTSIFGLPLSGIGLTVSFILMLWFFSMVRRGPIE